MKILSKRLLSIFALSCIIYSSYSQSQVDSLVIDYLNKTPSTTKAFYKIEKKGKKGTILSNYYYHPNSAIKFGGNEIVTYRFGLAASHSDVYFLLTIKQSGKKVYKVIDNNKIEDAISDLLKYLQPYNLSNSQNAQLINQLSFCHY
jgi:hypothetical protein